MNNETKALLGIGIVTILVVVVGSLFFTTSTPQTKTTATPTDAKLLLSDNVYKRGPDEAKVVIVEFADFQCPACGAAHPITKKVQQDYIDKIQMVFRHFPLPQHKNAMDAARAAEAAGAQGKFWEMHDVLYEKQDAWSEKSNAVDIFVGYAKDLGLNTDQFKKDLVEHKFDDVINKGLLDGNAAGVNSTPTFFMNGVKQVGIPSYTEFKSLIDSALAK
ncbi:thioredoxin domain-containing protein [Candidatus Woesebacteria bacterium]|nr:thioredoxin domain-containing protein [Candidatus Woesebacteria bacterium]